MESKRTKYIRVDKDSDRKFRYNGPCSKCMKNTDHRIEGGSNYENRYICMKCKTINTEDR